MGNLHIPSHFVLYVTVGTSVQHNNNSYTYGYGQMTTTVMIMMHVTTTHQGVTERLATVYHNHSRPSSLFVCPGQGL